MDIKGKVDDIVSKIKKDPSLALKFKDDPISAVEGIIGIDLPNDQVKNIADMVSAKLKLDKMGGKLGGLFGKK